MNTLKKVFGGSRSELLAIIVINSIREGDLTAGVPENTKADDLMSNIVEMSKALDASIFAIGTSTNSVSLMIDNISSNAWQMVEGAKMQAHQAGQIATASEEMSQTIVDIAKNSADASELSVRALAAVTKGKVVAEDSINKVNNVNTAVSELSSHIAVLNDRVKEIGNIVEIINDIADQTNLLALNAAIEAARAGDSGRGFAVVADEVRKLAEKTIKSTAQVSNQIKAVQTESDKTTGSMQNASDNINKSSECVTEMGNILNHITDAVSSAKDRVVQIATAVEEQATASEDITKNIENMASIARNTEEMAAKVMGDAASLMKIEESLRQSVLKFKTHDMAKTMIDVGKIDHRRFEKRILSVINGDLKLDGSSLPDHHNCRFGKWYDKDGIEKYSRSNHFKAIVPPHERIHAMAKEILNLYNGGNIERAKTLYLEMERVSVEIMKHLDALKAE